MKARTAPKLLATTALVITILSLPVEQARAQSALDVCTGITVNQSSVTDLLKAVNDPIVSPIQTTVNGLLTVVDPLTILTLPSSLAIDVDTIVDNAAASNPISLSVLNTDGNVIAPGECRLTSDGYQLNTSAGLSIGGNRITGLGDAGRIASAGTLDAIAFGNDATTTGGAAAAIAIGLDSSVSGSNGVALGANSSVTASNGVALGAGSFADAADTVSVGSASLKRRIVNLADGAVTAGSNEAVTGAQLFTTNTNVGTNTTAIAGLDGRLVTAEGTLGTNTAAIGTNTANIAALDTRVGTAETDLTTLGTRVTTNETDLTAIDGRLTTAEGTLGTNTTNIAALDTRVGAAETSLTAIDGRLTTAEGTLGTNTTNIAAIDGRLATAEGTVTSLGTRTTATEARITVNEADIAALQNFAVAYDGAGQTTVTLAGAGGTTLTNVAAGAVAAGSSDAVTGDQLFATNQSVAALDSRVALNRADLDTANGRLTLTETELAALRGASIVYDDGTQATLTLAGAGGTRIANVAPGTIAAGSSDAVTGGQLFATNQTVADNGAAVADLDGRVALTETGLATINGRLQLSEDELAALQGAAIVYDDGSRGTVTLAGAGGTVIANVGAGTVSADSTEAVTGAQLFATNQAVGALDTRVAQNETGIATNTTAIATLQTQIGDVEGDYAAVDGRITQNETDIATLDGRVGTNEASIGALDGRVTATETGLTALDGRVTATETGLAAMDGRVTDNTTQIGALDGRLTATEGTVAEIDGRVSANSDAIAAIDGELGATSGALAALDDRVTDTESGIGRIDSDLAILAEDVTGVDARVTSNTTAIASVGNRVAANESTMASMQAQIEMVPVRYVSDADPATPSTVQTNTVAFEGADGGTVRITNVAPAELSVGSSDAVTGGQLFETNRAVAANTASIQTITSNLAGSTVVAMQYSNADNPTVSNGGVITNDVTLVGANAAAPVALHNVAAGTAATDAVNVQQLQAGLGATLTDAMNYTDARVRQIGFDLADLRDDAFAGTAAAMAMNAIPQTMDGSGSMMGGAVGHYRGKTAFGFGFSSGFNDGKAVLKLSGTIDTQGKGGVAAGAGFAF